MMPTFIHGANIAFSMKLMLYLRFFLQKKCNNFGMSRIFCNFAK